MSYVHYRSSFAFVIIPLSILVFLAGIFSIVWLRSNVRTVEYSIAQLDNKRIEALKEKKRLLAEKAKIQAIQNVKDTGDGKLSMVFPDRVKVIYVKKERGTAPYKASLERGKQSGY